MPSPESATLLNQPGVWALPSRATYAATVVRNLDLIVIFLLVVCDIRVFKGSEVSSFTLFEIFAWVYCAPYVISCVVLKNKMLPGRSRNFLFAVSLYGIWLVAISLLALVLRGSSEVLQTTKNILPGIILVPYLLLRLHDLQQVILISNIYLIYGVSSAVLGLIQSNFGGPYFFELNGGIDYKQDLMGEIVSNPIVGFSTHPNQFAILVLPAAGWAAMQFWTRLRSSYRIDLGALAVASLIIVTMFVAQAKGGFAFTLVAIAFFASPLGRIRSFLVKLVWTSIVIGAVVYFGLSETESGGVPGAETLQTRVLLWETAARSLAADWYIAAFGDGRGYMAQWSESFAGWQFPNAHNTWIDQVVQFGVPALLMYLAIWWSFFRATETSIAARLPLNGALLDGCRVTILALMGDYFFEPASNDVSYFAELLLIMVIGLTVARVSTGNQVPFDAGVLRKAGPLSRQDFGLGR